MRSLSFSLCAFVTFLGYAAVNVHGVIPGPTWSGGQAGVSLNATELEIYSVQSDSGKSGKREESPFEKQIP